MKLKKIFVPVVVLMVALVTVLSRASLGSAHSVGRHEARTRRAAVGPVQGDGHAARAGDIESVAAAVESALDRHGENATAVDMRTLEEQCRAGSWDALEEVRALQGNEEALSYLESMGSDVAESYFRHRCGAGLSGEEDLLRAFIRRNDFSAQMCLDEACVGGQADTLRMLGVGRSIALRARAIEETLRRGHTEVVRLLFDRGVVTRKRSRDERISVWSYQGNPRDMSNLLIKNGLNPRDFGISEQMNNYFMLWAEVVEEVVEKEEDRDRKAIVVSHGKGYRSLAAEFTKNGLDTEKLRRAKGYDRGRDEIVWLWMAKASKVRYEVETRDANEACERNHLELVKLLVEKGVMPNQDGADSACDGGHAETLSYLLGLDILPRGWVMNGASKRGDMDVVRVLVKGVPELRTDEAGTYFANSACTGESIEVVRYLIEEGIRPSTAGADSACTNGNVEMVRYLIEEDIRPSTAGADSACTNGNVEMVRMVMNMTSGEVKPSRFGANSACRNGDIDMVKLLGENGVRPDWRGMRMARVLNFTEIVDYLKQQGVGE